ncbi:hypothetical protein D3C78_1844110 [compost metagenome]
MLAATRHRNRVVRHAQRLDLSHCGAVHRGDVHLIARLLRGQRHRYAVRHEESRIVDDKQQAARGAHACAPEMRRHTAM